MGGGTGDSDESVADVVGLVQRYFVVEGQNPYESDSMGYELRDVQVKYDKGTLIEELDGAIFPKFWSANASNTVATKYFRKAEIPGIERENDIRQLTGRVARGITRWGLNQGHISEAESEMFEKELVASSIFQYGAFNSPVWFSVGLDSYDINQEGENFFYVGHDSDGVRMVENYYEHPQASACFIMSPEDSIESMIQVGAVASSRIFKAGSGIGGDWSNVRSAGEPVSGGGKASGAVRFMDLQDSTGRVIKSGGKTRRAATMQSIRVWHPDMPEVLRHKYKEEEKARALIKAGSPNNWESHTIQDLRAQNVNISIRTDDDNWRTYESDGLYDIKNVTDGAVVRQEPAEKLLEMMAFAAHNCGDPGIQNHSIINKWNTCKNSGVIWA
jgi:ribonucleoside-diphosphate reductase alpha chain